MTKIEDGAIARHPAKAGTQIASPLRGGSWEGFTFDYSAKLLAARLIRAAGAEPAIVADMRSTLAAIG